MTEKNSPLRGHTRKELERIHLDICDRYVILERKYDMTIEGRLEEINRRLEELESRRGYDY